MGASWQILLFSLSFYYSALLCPQSAKATRLESVAHLRALTSGGVTLWELELSGTSAECALIIKKKAQTLSHKPATQECAQFFKWLTPAKLVLSRTQKNNGLMDDESLYELTLKTQNSKAQKAMVPLLAPKECELKKDGNMNCKVNDLNAAQLLLLRLRAYGNDENT